jgi:hypothetical protein
MLVPPDRAAAHPSVGYLLGLRGAGVTIEELFAWMDADADSGVMFGECELSFERALSPGAAYAVEGEIIAVERKVGRRAGAFDVLTFRLTLREDAGGAEVCASTNTWVFPRKEA